MAHRFNAVLLANHGLVAVGADMPAAFNTAEEVEFVARIYYQAKCAGAPVLLPDKEMDTVIEKFKTYGRVHPDAWLGGRLKPFD